MKYGFCRRVCINLDLIGRRFAKQIHRAVSYTHLDVYKRQDLPKLIGFLKRQETNGKFFSKAMQKELVTAMEEV